MKIRPFSLGRLVATPACIEAVPNHRILECINRFLKGDWGQSCGVHTPFVEKPDRT